MRFADIDAFFELGGPVRVIAHRGYSAVAPENTLAAFRRAIDVGADMIELDVLESREGELVVMHDETLERTTNGSGPVGTRDLAELKRLDAGSWHDPVFRGERIPTLGEALELARGHVLVNVELKSEAAVRATVTLIARMDLKTRVVLSSFEPRALEHTRAVDPSVRTASLRNPRFHRGWAPLRILSDVGSIGLNVALSEVDRELVEACHRGGRPVAVYTVDERDEMRRLIEMGVDAIFTNHPERLIALRQG